jgi:hypothetical protein
MKKQREVVHFLSELTRIKVVIKYKHDKNDKEKPIELMVYPDITTLGILKELYLEKLKQRYIYSLNEPPYALRDKDISFSLYGTQYPLIHTGIKNTLLSDILCKKGIEDKKEISVKFSYYIYENSDLNKKIVKQVPSLLNLSLFKLQEMIYEKKIDVKTIQNAMPNKQFF